MRTIYKSTVRQTSRPLMTPTKKNTGISSNATHPICTPNIELILSPFWQHLSLTAAVAIRGVYFSVGSRLFECYHHSPLYSDRPTMWYNVQYPKLSNVKDSWQTTRDHDFGADTATIAAQLASKIVRLQHAILDTGSLTWLEFDSAMAGMTRVDWQDSFHFHD